MAPFGCQALLLKQVAEPKDRRLVQQPRHGPQRGELAEHGDVVQRLLHRRVARREPLLQVVNRPGAVHPDDRTRDAAHIDYMPPGHRIGRTQMSIENAVVAARILDTLPD